LGTGNLGAMIKYLDVVVVYANKLVGYKDDDYLFSYVLDVVCDEIYDLISTIIMSVIAIRKDNQLGLRKDNPNELSPL
jgi:hypothetical protein